MIHLRCHSKEISDLTFSMKTAHFTVVRHISTTKRASSTKLLQQVLLNQMFFGQFIGWFICDTMTIFLFETKSIQGELR